MSRTLEDKSEDDERLKEYWCSQCEYGVKWFSANLFLRELYNIKGDTLRLS